MSIQCWTLHIGLDQRQDSNCQSTTQLNLHNKPNKFENISYLFKLSQLHNSYILIKHNTMVIKSLTSSLSYNDTAQPSSLPGHRSANSPDTNPPSARTQLHRRQFGNKSALRDRRTFVRSSPMTSYGVYVDLELSTTSLQVDGRRASLFPEVVDAFSATHASQSGGRPWCVS